MTASTGNPPTDTAYGAGSFLCHVRTDIAYGASSFLCHVRYWYDVLRVSQCHARYCLCAMSSTDIMYRVTHFLCHVRY
eukprot:3028320-Rhodomonas_salina.1